MGFFEEVSLFDGFLTFWGRFGWILEELVIGRVGRLGALRLGLGGGAGVGILGGGGHVGIFGDLGLGVGLGV